MAKNKLAAYQAKRDFKKTSEPSGKSLIQRAEYPRFIVQKHAATRLHYDLRLEHDPNFSPEKRRFRPVASSAAFERWLVIVRSREESSGWNRRYFL